MLTRQSRDYLLRNLCFDGILSAGVARAAFEEALSYAKERVQGGKPLIEHQNIQVKLFDMLSRVEMTRYLSRAAFLFNQIHQRLQMSTR